MARADAGLADTKGERPVRRSFASSIVKTLAEGPPRKWFGMPEPICSPPERPRPKEGQAKEARIARLIVNGIPHLADEYTAGPRSSVERSEERDQVKTDEPSGIFNYPNGWSREEVIPGTPWICKGGLRR